MTLLEAVRDESYLALDSSTAGRASLGRLARVFLSSSTRSRVLNARPVVCPGDTTAALARRSLHSHAWRIVRVKTALMWSDPHA
jgi:hypothetical protein